ncbi:MAG TPA: hypothetical protein VN838_30065 [Bradyrhizobium sp.]|nr:hypothetical protein [Bradyrhizobium sp.]
MAGQAAKTEERDDDPEIEFDLYEPDEDGTEIADDGAAEGDDPAADDVDDEIETGTGPSPEVAELRAELAKLKAQVGSVVPRIDDLDQARHEIAESSLVEAIGANEGLIQQATARRRQAQEEGNYDLADQLDEALFQLRTKRTRLNEMKAAGVTKAPKAAREEKAPAADLPERTWAPQTVAWMKRNPWFKVGEAGRGDPATAAAIAVSFDLEQRGIAASHPKHFQEVDKIMARQYPKLYAGNDRQRQAPAAAGPRRSASAADPGASAAERVRIPAGLIKNYEALGYDTKDPKVRQKIVDSFKATRAQHPEHFARVK